MNLTSGRFVTKSTSAVILDEEEKEDDCNHWRFGFSFENTRPSGRGHDVFDTASSSRSVTPGSPSQSVVLDGEHTIRQVEQDIPRVKVDSFTSTVPIAALSLAIYSEDTSSQLSLQQRSGFVSNH